jgi:hypothetical protein
VQSASLAKKSRDAEQVLLAQFLIPEKQNDIVVPGVDKARDGRIVQPLTQVEAPDFRTDMRRKFDDVEL